MFRFERMAPALIGLALAAPTTALAQSHEHSQGSCAYCNANSRSTPVVQQRYGPLARMLGGDRVYVPAGHHVEHPGQDNPGPVASWGDQAPGLPPAGPWYRGHNEEAGQAVVAPGYQPPAVSYGAPALTQAAPVAPGEPAPIGEMRTSYVPPTMSGAPSSMTATAPATAPSMMPPTPPDPRIQAWHQMNLSGTRVSNRTDGVMAKMLGLSSVNNWLQERRTIRAMKVAAKRGIHAPVPMMSEMPGQVVIGR